MNSSLEILEEILSSDSPIKNHVDKIAEIRKEIFEELSPEEIGKYSSRIKSKIQLEVKKAYYKTKEKHKAVIMATGTGKSRIPISIIEEETKNARGNSSYAVLLVVPTEKLRDSNWKEEFSNWDCASLYEEAERVCYASLDKISGKTYDFVIFDEGHNLTPAKMPFFENNTIKSSLLLTATKPKDKEKRIMLFNLGFSIIYELSLNEAVQLGVVAPYEIHIVDIPLDNRVKYLKGGNKLKPFFQTESKAYTYLSKKYEEKKNATNALNRMRLIYNLRSKTNAARYLLENIIPKKARTIIFCGSKEQAALLSDNCFYSKPSLEEWEKKYPDKVEKYNFVMGKWKGEEPYNLFKNEIVDTLSCVNALNEGHNLPNVDIGLIVQLNSNEKDFIQRLGRVIRFRPNHVGKIIILRTVDTVDEKWVRMCIEKLNCVVREYSFSRLEIGLDKIELEEDLITLN